MPPKQNNTHFRRDKLTVSYDEDARKEYLTGFRKRKQERRKVAQDQITLRVKEEKKAEKLELRRAAKEALTTTEEYEVPSALPAPPEPSGPAAEAARAEFADDFSRARFGAQSVIVTTAVGLLDDDEDVERLDKLKELAAAHKRKRAEAAAAEPGGKAAKREKWTAVGQHPKKFKAKHG